MKIKKNKNKGELSELYTLIRLLADGKVYTVKEDLIPIANCFLQILEVSRHEEPNHHIEYKIIQNQTNENHSVALYINDNFVTQISDTELDILAKKFYKSLTVDDGMIVGEQIMERLSCTKVKAPSSDKTDITLQVHDPFTNLNTICGYSIKSDIGNPPTLLNASQATNFIFEVFGLSAEQISTVNSIETKSKILDRIQAIKKHGKLKFISVANETFAKNLLFIDTQMEYFLAVMLETCYTTGIKHCAQLVTVLEQQDPFNLQTENLYRHKLKKFLCAVALGLSPTKLWNGLEEVNGGYIIVKKNGYVVAYHLHDRNSFENYLLNNTYFETPSTSRHELGKIYPKGNRYFINLNLQIRFKKPS